MVAFLVASGTAQQLPLLPWPDSISTASGKFRITSALSISTASNDPVLLKAANRFHQQLNGKTRAFFSTGIIRQGQKGSISVSSGQVVDLKPGVDETYTLIVNASGITLTSANTIGALRGLETLLQLAIKDEEGYYFPFVSIVDKPRFPWRGLMIDVARHFITMDVLKRNVDAMATVKMNVLHLHLTDDEGFRIESKHYPKLHQLGSNGSYYTQEEMKQLVSYAKDRGIMVIPEFDLPGHSRSWFAGYPEMASTPGTYTPGPRFDVTGKSMPEVIAMMNTFPSATIDPTKEEVYKFLEGLLAEMKTIFPAAYVHIGADENNGVAWKQNPAIVAFMKKNNIADVKALEQYFVNRMHKLVTKNNYRMIVWEEAFAKDLPKDVIVQKWRPEMGMMGAPVTTNTILKQGNDVLMSTSFYLDHHMPAHAYYLNPALMKLKGVDTLKGKLIGGEAAQWTEIANNDNIEGRMWVNTAAIAERFWSRSVKTDTDDLYARLEQVNLQLDAQGLQHIAGYERALRAMTCRQDVSDARLLTDVLTPLKGYKRIFGRMSVPPEVNLPIAPLSTVADILPMNSFVKRDFRRSVAAYLADPAKSSEVRDQLQQWTTLNKWNDHGNTELKAVAPQAARLSELASTALEAMDLRAKGEVPADWIKSKQELLKKAGTAVAETELDVLPELQALINGKLLPEATTYPLF